MIGREAVLLAARPWCSSGNSKSNNFIVILADYKEENVHGKRE